MVIYAWFSIIRSFYIFLLISVDSSCRANIILQGLKNNLKNKKQPIIILTDDNVSIPKLKKKDQNISSFSNHCFNVFVLIGILLTY